MVTYILLIKHLLDIHFVQHQPQSAQQIWIECQCTLQITLEFGPITPKLRRKFFDVEDNQYNWKKIASLSYWKDALLDVRNWFWYKYTQSKTSLYTTICKEFTSWLSKFSLILSRAVWYYHVQFDIVTCSLILSRAIWYCHVQFDIITCSFTLSFMQQCDRWKRGYSTHPPWTTLEIL